MFRSSWPRWRPSLALAAPAGAATTDPIAHDPTLIKQGGWYYDVITGDSGAPDTYLPMRRSRDLVHWESLGPVFTTAAGVDPEELGITPGRLLGARHHLLPRRVPALLRRLAVRAPTTR